MCQKLWMKRNKAIFIVAAEITVWYNYLIRLEEQRLLHRHRASLTWLSVEDGTGNYWLISGVLEANGAYGKKGTEL